MIKIFYFLKTTSYGLVNRTNTLETVSFFLFSKAVNKQEQQNGADNFCWNDFNTEKVFIFKTALSHNSNYILNVCVLKTTTESSSFN